MKINKKLLIAVTGLIAILTLGPFLVPVPDLEGTTAPKILAFPDSNFVTINNLTIHYKTAGSGDPVMILLHGFGASQFTWQAVVPELSTAGRVIAYDRPAFGLTDRPLSWEGINPYSDEVQVNLVVDLMDEFGFDQAVLIGNSAGGKLATKTALAFPYRVTALVLVDAAIYAGGGAPSFVKPLLKTPQMQHIGPLIARRIQTSNKFLESAWHDPSKITEETINGYRYPLQVQNWDKALWELTIASSTSDLEEELETIQLPVLVLTGDDDRIVPTEQSIQLAEDLPNAELKILDSCGHLPQEECPEAFLDAVLGFLEHLE